MKPGSEPYLQLAHSKLQFVFFFFFDTTVDVKLAKIVTQLQNAVPSRKQQKRTRFKPSS